MTHDDVRSLRPEPADADPVRFSRDLLSDFYRDVRPGDWRNRPLPRLRRWCHPIGLALSPARRGEALR
jgi:hypothetical protein